MQDTASLKLPCTTCAALEISILETAQVVYSRKGYAFFFPLCPKLSIEEIFCGEAEINVATAFVLWLRIRGNLSPSVLAKNKGSAVFRLVSDTRRG